MQQLNKEGGAIPKSDIEWAELLEFPGHHASDFGDIRNPRGKILSQRKASNGALQVDLRRNGRQYTRLVATLVLAAFTGQPVDSRYRPVNLNDDKTDNRLINLAWTCQ